jgi:glycogen debranching enzyme
VKRFYPHMVKYERWLVEDKRAELDPDMIAYYNWCDVGWDDTKRWGKGGFVETADWDFPIIPVDANVFFSILRDTLSKFAGLLGEEERQRDYAEKAARTREAIQKRMWSEASGFYFDLFPDGRQVDVWSPAGFMPMLAGIPSPDQYQRLRSHMLDTTKFWTKYPLPTLAIDDPDFMEKDGGWRGGTWGVVNWQVCEGLFDYDPELALRFLQRTLDMMTRDGHATCFEFYDPISGDGKRAIDNGFSAMPIDLLLRRVFGINPSPAGLELKPYLPAEWPEASICNVFVAGTGVAVEYHRSGDGLNATVKNTGSKEITVTSGPEKQTLAPGQEKVITVASA